MKYIDIIYSVLNETVSGYNQTPDEEKNRFLVDKSEKLRRLLFSPDNDSPVNDLANKGAGGDDE